MAKPRAPPMLSKVSSRGMDEEAGLSEGFTR